MSPSDTPAALRIAVLPDSGSNPYLRLLAEALEAEGVQFVGGHNGLLGRKWLKENAGRGIRLHFHWLHTHYAPRGRARLGLALKFASKLWWARHRGYRLSWTCHNLAPHDAGGGGRLHRFVRRRLCRLADVVFVHSATTVPLVEPLLGRGAKCRVVPHGNFIGVCGEAPSRQGARQRLGLDKDAYVYCLFGRLRRYKGIEELIAAFTAIARSQDRLLIAGEPGPGYREHLVAAAGANPAVILRAEWLPDAELAACMAAADALVFPFKQILNSGSVILAMSYRGLCVVPSMGSLPEVLPGHAAIYFDPQAPGALARALTEARSLAPDEAKRRRERAYAAAQALQWRDAARGMVEALYP